MSALPSHTAAWSSSAWAGAADPAPGVLLNVSGTLAAGTTSQSIPLLDAGWSVSDLCASLASSPSSCSLQVTLTQTSPAASAGGCALTSAVQVACKTQTDDPHNYAQMVCVSLATPGKPESTLFPQDSPTLASMQTVLTGPGGAGAGAATGRLGESVVQNPATAFLSPAMLNVMERVATRNRQASAQHELAEPAVAAATQTLPVRVLLLNAHPGSCGGADISYELVVRLEANDGCASYAWAPGATIIIPGTNTTNSSSVDVPGWNVTTPVACASPHGSCVLGPTDTDAPWNGNVTAQCVCDRGWGPADADGGADCFADRGLDLSVPPGAARPPAWGNASDPASDWIDVNSSPVKGRIGGVYGLLLNATASSSSSSVFSPSSAVAARVPTFSAYWHARLNLSRALQDLSLVVHISVLSPSPASSVAPVQLSLSPDFYPALGENTPFACLNGTDLGPAKKLRGDDDDEEEEEERGVGEAGAGPAMRTRTWAAPGLADGSSSCATLVASYPDAVAPSSSAPSSFRLVLHPAFVAGFLDRANATRATSGGGDGGDGETTVYLSLFFQQPLLVDVRVWWQQNLEIYTPRRLDPPARGHASNDASAPTAAADTGADRDAHPDSAAASSLAQTRLGDEIAPQNQTWVQTLLENDLVYFHLNTPHKRQQTQLFSDTDHAAGRVGGNASVSSGVSVASLADGELEQASLYVVINDTACVSGAAVQGYYAPHWWRGAMTPAAAAAAGVAQSPLPAAALPPVAGRPAHMALNGGCLRPFERLATTPAAAAGLFGQLYSVCAAAVELTVWHIVPLLLDTKGMDSGAWTSARLNATGSSCWRELAFTISTSVPNDLLFTVDQADAVVLLKLQSNDAAAPPDYPTLQSEYNVTKQVAVEPTDGAGSATKWQQRRIAYADLSHSQTWFVAVYLDPSPGDGGVPHPPRTFRVRMSWGTDGGSFAHMSRTLVVIFSVAGSIAGLLLMVAIKMRVDACRRDRAAKGKADAKLEKIRLMQQGRQHQDYMRL